MKKSQLAIKNNAYEVIIEQSPFKNASKEKLIKNYDKLLRKKNALLNVKKLYDE